MRVVSFSVPAWFPSYDEARGRPARQPAREPRDAQLTDQESAVFLCLATGASNAELAAELQLSVSTVKFHVVNIRAKLGGISRLQACLLSALAREGARPVAGDAPTTAEPAGAAPGPGGAEPALSAGGAAAGPR
ncbi:response regulator transcription factor [Streptomyces sp. NPDC055254]